MAALPLSFMRVDQLPHLNAVLNSASTVLLLTGYLLIRRGDGRERRWKWHAASMIAAAVTSVAFLVGYLILHYHVKETRIAEKFPYLSHGVRTVYFLVLFPHLLLAIVMLPMIFLTFFRAIRRDWARHRRIAPPTFWIWIYVSFTGVLIYWMLYHLFPRMGPVV